MLIVLFLIFAYVQEAPLLKHWGCLADVTCLHATRLRHFLPPPSPPLPHSTLGNGLTMFYTPYHLTIQKVGKVGKLEAPGEDATFVKFGSPTLMWK